MAQSTTKRKAMEFADRIKNGWGGSMRSLERVEAEGEKLLKNMAEFAEKVVPEGHRKALEELARDAVEYVGQLNARMEEDTRRILDKLNIPTRKELDAYNKRVQVLVEEAVRARIERLPVASAKDLDELGRQMKKNVEGQTLKVFGRLNIATKKDVDSVAKEVKRLRRDVDAITKPPVATKRAKAPGKKATPARKKAST